MIVQNDDCENEQNSAQKAKSAGEKCEKPTLEGFKSSVFREKQKKKWEKRRTVHQILRSKLWFQQKTTQIICAKDAFHFWKNNGIMVTSYRRDIEKWLSCFLHSKQFGMSSRLLRILGLRSEPREIPYNSLIILNGRKFL